MLPWILLAVLGQQQREDLRTHERVGTQYPTTEYKYKPDVATTYEQMRSTATVKPGYLKPKAHYVNDATFMPSERVFKKFETSHPATVEPKKYLKPKARYATFTPTEREFKKFETSVPEAGSYMPKVAKIELEYDNSYQPKSVDGHYESQYPTDYHYDTTYDYTYEPSSVDGHYESQYPTDYHYDNTYDYTYEPSSVDGHYESQYPTDYHYENTYENTYEPSVDGHYESQYPTDYHYENTYEPSSAYTDIMLEKETNEPTSDEHEKHHDEEEHENDGPPECLKSCEFGEDFHNDMCMWWEHQDPRHNAESCFDNCSPGIIFYFESNCEEPELNEEENEEDPFACVMDCPIEDLDPHSAESFCPWFSTHKATECFMDCSNDFLNMAQDHAEHTCAEFAQEDQFTSYIHYIEEPLIEILEEEKMKYEHLCPPGFMQNADICQVCPAATYSFIGQHDCTPCPEGLTSFPGSESEIDCYERKALNIVDSDSNSSYQSEDKDMSEDSDMNSSYQSKDKSHDDMSSEEQFEGEHGEDFDNSNSKVSGELEVPAGQEYSTSAEDMKKEAQLHN